MKDPLLPLRIAYVEKLESLGLSVFEEGAVPAEAKKPYVIVSTQTALEDSNKSDYGHEATTLLDIVTGVPINKTGGSKEADLIAGTILININSKTKFLISDDFQSVSLRMGDSHKITGNTATERIFRRLIRFEQTIRQIK